MGFVIVRQPFLIPAETCGWIALAGHWEAVETGAAKTGVSADRSTWRIARQVYVADTTAEARKEALSILSGWTLVEGREAMSKRFVFRDFNEAFGWMSRVAMLAEKLDHHPEWSNVYKTVEVTLSTHDAGGLTELDVRLARAMDAMAS